MLDILEKRINSIVEMITTLTAIRKKEWLVTCHFERF